MDLHVFYKFCDELNDFILSDDMDYLRKLTTVM
jgi:hypothetical protein